MLSWGAARGIESVSDNDDDSGKGKSGCRAPSYGRGNRLPTMPQPGRSSSDSRYQSRSLTSCQCDHCPAQGARNLYPPSSSRHQKGACTPPPIMEKKSGNANTCQRHTQAAIAACIQVCQRIRQFHGWARQNSTTHAAQNQQIPLGATHAEQLTVQ